MDISEIKIRKDADEVISSEAVPGLLMNRLLLVGIASAFLCQVVLLILVGWQNRDLLSHTDGIFYMRIASYYAMGNFDLAISGYWGPLYSWLIVPFLGFVEKPLYAARIVMGLSAVVFLFGCVSILRNLELQPWGVIAGTWISALASVAWSVESNNPDLLMSGLMGLAIGRVLSPRWLRSRSTQVVAGTLWATAYFAKGVAFPLAITVICALAALWGISRTVEKKIIIQSTATTIAIFLIVSSVWISVLSFKYHRLVISTSGRINHTIVGPSDKERYHPDFYAFIVPEKGRISVCEDLSNMPYHYWSPFDNLEYAKHQMKLIYFNAEKVIKHLLGFSSMGLGFISIILGLIICYPSRQNWAVQRWRWTGVIVLILCAIYLPVYAVDQRYYYPSFPFLVAASIGLVVWFTPQSRQGFNLPRLIGIGFVIIGFVIPASAALERSFEMTGKKLMSIQAYDLAKKLEAKGLQGTVAGGSTEGLHVAFCMNQPWYGSGAKPIAATYKGSNANLIIIHRKPPLVGELDHDSAFVNLDSLLFDSAEQANKSPLKVYELIPANPDQQ